MKQQTRLILSQGNLIKTLHLQHELVDAMNKRISGFQHYLASYREVFGSNQQVFASIKELLDEQLKLVKDVEHSLKAVEKAFAESNVTINENTERTQKLLAKMEAYFGTTGLDYDN
jgi:septal ring factor EnvC (AmiA/AmiB activator)